MANTYCSGDDQQGMKVHLQKAVVNIRDEEKEKQHDEIGYQNFNQNTQKGIYKLMTTLVFAFGKEDGLYIKLFCHDLPVSAACAACLSADA